MAGIMKGAFDHSSEIRPFADGRGHFAVIDMDGMSVGRAVFEPGWRWSDHVKPIAGTDSCRAAHAGYVMSGHLTVRMDDGTEENFDPGDVMIVHPGHDAWTVGNEACVMLDWQAALDYAKAKATTTA
jgi:quercetin dioxygenase-like cupin family protein